MYIAMVTKHTQLEPEFVNMTGQLRDFVNFGKKIAGAGLNYKGLLKIRNLPDPEKPVIFLKSSSSYITEGQHIEVLPDGDVHQEVELGVVVGRRGRDIAEVDAESYIGGYCLALDMTDAGVMKECREKGLPWTLGKSFDTACPVSRFIAPHELTNAADVRIWSKVNGILKQDCSTQDMFFSIPRLVSFISRYMTLEPGDLILTGSPPGMGPVVPGDVIECGLGDVVTMKFPVKARP